MTLTIGEITTDEGRSIAPDKPVFVRQNGELRPVTEASLRFENGSLILILDTDQ